MILLDLLYLAFGLVLSPWLFWRAVRTGRYRRQLLPKLIGSTNPARDDPRPVAWFHGVSVGEIHLLVPLVQVFRQRFPNWRLVISSTTDTGLSEAAAKFADLDRIPFPIDFSWAVERTLAEWRPRLVILAESELWPNLLRLAARRNIPVAVINTRISPRSFRRWKQLRSWASRLIFPYVQLWAVQSQEHSDRLLALGVCPRRVLVTGSIKYDGATGDRNSCKAQELRRLLRPAHAREFLIWVAGSTHDPEENLILGVYRQLKSSTPNLRLILVPRHPDRFQVVADLLSSEGVNSLRRSALVAPLADWPDVLLLDTVGELGAAWALADLGFTGGSLDGHRGGQSMIEPAGFGVPTVFGPHVWNFREPATQLVQCGGAIQVQDVEELRLVVGDLLRNKALREKMGQAAQAFVLAQQGATERTVNALAELIARDDISAYRLETAPS